MKNISVIVSFKIKDDDLGYAVRYLKKFVAASKNEKGNISMSFLKSTENQNEFLFIELWKSQKALLEHTQSEHFAEFAPFFNFTALNLDVKIMANIPV